MPKDKVVVIYATGGAGCDATARACACEELKRARAGRQRAPIEPIAEEVTFAWGLAGIAEIDVLDK